MAEVALRAEVRDDRGKGPARRLRAQGKVPGILYGRGAEPVAVAVDARQLQHTFATDSGLNVLIDLQVNGETHLTLARSLERHPIRGSILHVDFLKIARDQQITVDVPFHFDGDSRGVREGGVLEHHLWQVHVSCLPSNVPERISIDIRDLGIGDVVRVGDLTIPDGVEMLSDPEEIIVTCVVPQKAEEVAPSVETGVATEATGEAQAAPPE